MATLDKCFWPIVYVRGYAMTDGEVDDTAADPFCGFNLGSTVMRATVNPKQPAKKFVFESPVIRLRSDYGYEDVYDNGVDLADPDWSGTLARKSIVIYRYYDSASDLLGDGTTPTIEDFAKGLSQLILKLRDRVCADSGDELSRDEFRCYLVAHSMGGLVCRAFLQNPALGDAEARSCVAKFFTYATPHNGIEIGSANVPAWLGTNDINNFNRKRMAQYLNLEELYERTKRVDWMPETVFPSQRIFCAVGTNRADYEAAAGLSRTFAGHGSDGLVRIANATLCGVDETGQPVSPTASAYVYRSHSGHFGIVNSEESYQNLARFLFGDVRVDIWADIEEVRVPQELEAVDRQGKLDALYQFEVLASPRGKRWYLTRRVAEEDSVACRTHAELRQPDNESARHVYLSTVFLANRFRVAQKQSLAYNMTFGVRVPDYEVDQRFWPDRHYEGGYLFRDSVVIEMMPAKEPGDDWSVTYDWQSDNVGQSSTPIPTPNLQAGKVVIRIPFATKDATPPRSPGIKGCLRFVVSVWNS